MYRCRGLCAVLKHAYFRSQAGSQLRFSPRWNLPVPRLGWSETLNFPSVSVWDWTVCLAIAAYWHPNILSTSKVGIFVLFFFGHEDILACRHNFKGWFRGSDLALRFGVRIRVCTDTNDDILIYLSDLHLWFPGLFWFWQGIERRRAR